MANNEVQTPATRVKIACSDGKAVVMDMKTACFSKTIRDALSNCEASGEEEEEVPLPGVPSDCMKVVKEWAEHHQDDSEAESGKFNINNWDTQFVKKFDKDFLFALTRAVNYLDMECFLRVCCLAVVDNLKGKTAPEIRSYFELN